MGAGWNRTEMRNHGTDPRVRMAVMRERVEAMRDLDHDEASYHGKYVNFDRIWSWPKPRNGHTHQSSLVAPAQPSSIGCLGSATPGSPPPPPGVRPHRRAAPRRPTRPVQMMSVPGDPKVFENSAMLASSGSRGGSRQAALAPRTSPGGVGEGDRGVQPGDRT